MVPRNKDYSLCYLPGMAISRRQFFRGLVGPTPEQLRERRVHAVETYVRTNLLPYDFGLSAEQTSEALSAAIAEVDLDTIEDGITGFLFDGFTTNEFLHACIRAIDHYQHPETWQEMQREAMSRDFGWDRSEQKYRDVYRRVLAAPRFRR